MNDLNSKTKIKKTLLDIANILNENHINWGLGGSLLLYLYGIDTTVTDIDIVIDYSDIEKVEEIVEKYNHIEKNKSEIFLTEKFFSITKYDIDIDLMVGFKIFNPDGIYSFPISEKLADKTINIDGTTIYLCSLKDWLEAYIAMGRTNKVELIQQSKMVK